MTTTLSRKARIRAGIAAAAVVGLGAVMLVGTPAYAASANCGTTFFACTTNPAVSAHPYGHYIRVTTRSCGNITGPWRVFDVANNKTVASGAGDSPETTRTITGLYGSYKASISGLAAVPPGLCVNSITLDNDWN